MSRNKYPEETVAKILDVALELFSTKGYEATSIQDIVNGLDGLSKGAIYHHFKSKDEILDAALDRVNAPVMAELERVRDARGLTGAEKLNLMYGASSSAPQMQAWAKVAPAADPIKNARLLGLEYRGSMVDSVERFLLPVIEEGVHDGSISCACPREAAEVLSLLANLWLVRMFLPDDDADAEVLERRISCFVAVAHSLGIELDEQRLRGAVEVPSAPEKE